MASTPAQQWWVITGTSFGSAPTHTYFEGTQAQAVALSRRVVEVSVGSAVTGPFPTKTAAMAAVASKKVNTPTVGEGGPSIPTLGNPLTGIDAIGAFFNDLGDANTWIRVAKVVVGGTLIIVGLAKLTGVGGIAAKAVKAAPLL